MEKSETTESKPSSSKAKNLLNSKFFDSSSDDPSSSSCSERSENTSTEVHKVMTSIRAEKFRALIRGKGSSGFGDQQKLPESKDNGSKGEGLPLFLHRKTDPLRKELSTITSEPSRQILPPVFKPLARVAVLVIIWTLCTAVLIEKKEKVSNMYQISIPPGDVKSYWMSEKPSNDLITVKLEGAFLPHYYANLSAKFLTGWLEMLEMPLESTLLLEADAVSSKIANISDPFIISIVSEELIDVVPVYRVKRNVVLKNFNSSVLQRHAVRIRMATNLCSSFPVMIDFDLSPIPMEYGVVYGALVLLLLYVLIIFEVVHRTLASLVAATVSVAVLASLDDRPTVSELASWIDFETLLLLFSMMVLVAIFSETGIFDYLAVYAYKVTGGRVWPLINTLCIFTAFLSCFLDNVTTALLMTPVTIRLCEVTSLNPVPVLMTMMIYSNLGGAITPVGDPPNVIVSSHPDVRAMGVDFSVFFIHMFVGIALVAVVIQIQLRYMFKNLKDFRTDEDQDVEDLRLEIAVWERAAASISSYSKEEDNVKDSLHRRVRRLIGELTAKSALDRVPQSKNYEKNLAELKEKYPIRNKSLLFKSGFTLFFVIIVFFLHSVPELNLSLGCTAFMGALLLLLLSNETNFEGVLARVEWSTLLFFASLFILMEALSRLRLIEWIGQHTEHLIQGIEESYRLPVSILLILWISAGVSAFVDNIPLTTMMIRIVTSLAENPELRLPLMPLVWALCYGACLGGLATLIGSSSNVVCAGVAEQHGYRFTFVQYSKVGIPVMLVSVLVISGYLMIAHVVLGWNE